MKSSPPRRPPASPGIIGVWSGVLLGSFNATLTGGAAWYTWRAEKELPRAEAALRAAGYTLDPVKLAAPDVPDAENKGAVEPLLGVAALRDEDETPEIKLRIARLEELRMRQKSRDDAQWQELAKKIFEGGVIDAASLKDLRPAKREPEIPEEGPIDWKAWVDWLEELQWPLPSTELTHAGTVYGALERKTAFLTTALRAAEGRKYAAPAPCQQSRFAAAIARGDISLGLGGNTRYIGLMRTLKLQMEAALASGKEKEAAALVPLLFALRDIAGAEVSLYDWMVRQTADRILADAVQRNLAAGRMPPEILKEFQRGLAARPVFEGADRILNMELAWSCYMTDQVMKQQVSFDAFRSLFNNPEDYRDQRSTFAEPLVQSLAKLNRAAAIRIFLENVQAWKAGGPLGYYHAVKARDERPERGAIDALLHLDSVVAESGARGMHRLWRTFFYTEMRRNLLLAACALERHRLAGGVPLENLSGLPKSLLAEVPADLDGQPIRYRKNEGGWVLWSVGIDLQDDLKGALPAPVKMEPIQFADWQWRYRDADRQ